MFSVKTCSVLILMGTLINGAASRTYSYKGFQTSSSKVPNFPEFVSVEMVNGLQISHYSSETKRVVPKQDWMNRVTEDDPYYWERETQISLNSEQVDKASIEIVKQRLNQTEGAHINQWMFGCDWDDETDEITGYYQSAFDGEDFIALDLNTETWVAPKPEAVITKHKWERTGEAVRQKDYINNRCAESLKRYVLYGADTLKRTELPLVSLLQKSSSAPVTCHATGFYPEGAVMFWTKAGDELHEGVDPGEILPNHDGTFQMSVDLDVSSVRSEDWDQYECVFQISGVKEDLLTRLDPAKIRTNEKKNQIIIIIAVALGVLVVAVLTGVGVFLVRRCKAPSKAGSAQQLINNRSTIDQQLIQPVLNLKVKQALLS